MYYEYLISDVTVSNRQPIPMSISGKKRHVLENVEHCGGEPEQGVTMWATHEQTKLDAEIMSRIA